MLCAYPQEVGMSSTLLHIVGQRGKEINMEVLIGKNPHKATNALAAIDERGKLLESTPFSPPTEPVVCARLCVGASVSRSAAGRWKAPEGWGAP